MADNEYSTRGGISGYILRFTSPSASRPLSVVLRTFGEMSGSALPMVLKRVLPFSDRRHSISNAHLPEKRETTLRMGQLSIWANFFIFSAVCKLLIFNIYNF